MKIRMKRMAWYVQMDDEGWLATDSLELTCSSADAFQPQLTAEAIHLEYTDLMDLAVNLDEPTISLPGVCSVPGTVFCMIFVRHWLIITLFTAFNILLHFI